MVKYEVEIFNLFYIHNNTVEEFRIGSYKLKSYHENSYLKGHII